MNFTRDIAVIAVGGVLMLWLIGVSGILEKRNPEPIPTGEEDTLEEETREISLYFYSPERDIDDSGNIKCSRDGLFEVKRTIPLTETPMHDAVRLLMKGELTAEERSQGITTEFPLASVELVGISNNNGDIVLEFRDPLNRTSGGACRAGILWYQIERTVLQFPGIDSVRFIPEELFQP